MDFVKVYHYTDFSKVGQILGKFQDTGESLGLEPRAYIGQTFGPAREKPASFAFLEPVPGTWINNKYFPLTWKTLVHDFGILDNGKLLLEISINPQIDEVYVGDRSHLEGVLYPDKTDIPEKYLHKSLEEGEQKFMESLIPLGEYLERQKRGEDAYLLPEVVIFNSIPIERIRVSETQPLIEEDLTKLHSEGKKHLVELIVRGYVSRELTPWRRNYESKHGLLGNNSGLELLG